MSEQDADRIVVIKTPTGFIPRVDAISRRATAESQQFVLHADGSLTILAPPKWVDDPAIVEVGRVNYR